MKEDDRLIGKNGITIIFLSASVCNLSRSPASANQNIAPTQCDVINNNSYCYIGLINSSCTVQDVPFRCGFFVHISIKYIIIIDCAIKCKKANAVAEAEEKALNGMNDRNVLLVLRVVVAKVICFHPKRPFWILLVFYARRIIRST